MNISQTQKVDAVINEDQCLDISPNESTPKKSNNSNSTFSSMKTSSERNVDDSPYFVLGYN